MTPAPTPRRPRPCPCATPGGPEPDLGAVDCPCGIEALKARVAQLEADLTSLRRMRPIP